MASILCIYRIEILAFMCLVHVQVETVTVTGSNNGLHLELYLDQTNYMQNKLTKAAGARINVHDP